MNAQYDDGHHGNIRRIIPADNAAIQRIIQQGLARFGLDVPGTAYFDPQLDALSDFYDAQSHDRGRGYFVAIDDDGGIIGGAGYAHFSGAAPDIAELQKLYIAPQGQGSGVSYRLIELIEQAARADGYRELYLETHHALQAAIHIYERCGFERLASPIGKASHVTMDRFFIKSL